MSVFSRSLGFDAEEPWLPFAAVGAGAALAGVLLYSNRRCVEPEVGF